jgi:hypothetical protein
VWPRDYENALILRDIALSRTAPVQQLLVAVEKEQRLRKKGAKSAG